MQYFTIEELTASDTARARGIDNTPGATERACLVTLIDTVLDPVRRLWGKPIRVNSGYRCPALNAAVRGSATSHHLRGMAADITTGDRYDNKLLLQMIAASTIPFTQLLWEKGDDTGPQWIHISLDPANPKRETRRIH